MNLLVPQREERLSLCCFMWFVEKFEKSEQVSGSPTLSVIAGVNAVPGHGNVLMRVV